jgi:hypothetical protein
MTEKGTPTGTLPEVNKPPNTLGGKALPLNIILNTGETTPQKNIYIEEEAPPLKPKNTNDLLDPHPDPHPHPPLKNTNDPLDPHHHPYLHLHPPQKPKNTNDPHPHQALQSFLNPSKTSLKPQITIQKSLPNFSLKNKIDSNALLINRPPLILTQNQNSHGIHQCPSTLLSQIFPGTYHLILKLNGTHNPSLQTLPSHKYQSSQKTLLLKKSPLSRMT